METEKTFAFSGLPNYIEAYLCYDDPASDKWLDGSELLQNRDRWDEKQCAKWNFFYRVVKGRVGAPQKAKINEREEAIWQARVARSAAENNLADLAAQAKKDMKSLTTKAIVAGASALLLLFLVKLLVILPLAGAIYVLYEYMGKKNQNDKEVEALQNHLVHLDFQMATLADEIVLLRSEIEELVKQIPERPAEGEMEEWLLQELRALECRFLGSHIGEDVTNENISNFIRHWDVDSRVHGILIDGWALIQDAKTPGMSRMKRLLGQRMAVWRGLQGGRPLFRCLYLQFIFLLKENLNVSSAFYDFVTRETYGLRDQTFQDPHVTEFSLEEAEVESAEIDRAEGLIGAFAGVVAHVFTLGMASGARFSCVLADREVIGGLNRVLALREEAERKAAEMQELETRVPDGVAENVELLKDWHQKQRELQDEQIALVREYTKLEELDIQVARTALRTVREQVTEIQRGT